MFKDATLPDADERPAPALSDASEAGRYSLVQTTLDSASPELAAEWRRFRAETPSPMHDPRWLEGYFEGQTSNLRVYSLFKSGSLCGFAPFLRREWPLKWHLGELCIANWPLTRLRLLGGPPAFPEDEAAYDLLFSQLLANGGFDTLFLEDIPVDSSFWKYLRESKLVRESFLLYQPDRVSPHPILRIEGSFEQYLGQFSSKHRKNLLRSIRKMRDGSLGEMRFVRYERLCEVGDFLNRAVEVSRKTYQWQLHKRGLSATDLVRKRLNFAAEHGWMRCYLLFCGQNVCAFIVGYQYEGTFFLDEIGHDPEFSKHSVGTVIQMLSVEDLFNYNRPKLFDLQDYAWYKDTLSNDSFLQGRVFLFRRSSYSQLLRAGHAASCFITSVISSGLTRFGLKSKIRKTIRALFTVASSEKSKS